MSTEFDQKVYNSAYYDAHKQDILRAKREKYKKDKEYRDRVKQASRDKYKNDKVGSGEKVYSFGESQEDPSVVKGTDGILYYSAKHAARQAGVGQSTIRRWVDEGIIPAPLQEEGGRGWRWFTPTQLLILKKFRGYNTSSMKSRAALRLYAKQHWMEGSYAKTERKRNKEEQTEDEKSLSGIIFGGESNS